MAHPVRPMTPGEIAMAQLLFRDAVDYDRVRIHGRGFFWFGLQQPHVAMAPNGNIYFTPKLYRPDFSVGAHKDRHWFMHEMVHVWQHQLGYPVMLRGAIRLFLKYDYQLSMNRRLADYDMEAQGELLADYFALRFLRNPHVTERTRKHAGSLAMYEVVLQDFLRAPGEKVNLPRRFFQRG